MARRKGSPRLSPETLELMRNDSGRVYRDTFRPAPGRSVTPIAEGRAILPAGSGRNFNPRGGFNYNAADETLARGRQAATMRAADEAAAQARGQQDANTLSDYAQLLERLNASRGARRPAGGYDQPGGRGPNVRDIDLIGRPDRQVPGVRYDRIGDHRIPEFPGYTQPGGGRDFSGLDRPISSVKEKPGGGRNNDAKSPAGRGKGKAGRGKGKDFERMLRSRMSRY
jgi:hypothetical protein